MGGGRGKATILQKSKKIAKKIFFDKNFFTDQIVFPNEGDWKKKCPEKKFFAAQEGGGLSGPSSEEKPTDT